MVAHLRMQRLLRVLANLCNENRRYRSLLSCSTGHRYWNTHEIYCCINYPWPKVKRMGGSKQKGLLLQFPGATAALVGSVQIQHHDSHLQRRKIPTTTRHRSSSKALFRLV